MKYRRLSRWFNVYYQLPDELRECRAFMTTPGILPLHLVGLMKWPQPFQNHLQLLEELDDDPIVQEMRHANIVGVDQADGEAMLRTMLTNYPSWGRSVPLWATRYLQARRRRGAGARELAREFNTLEHRIRRWWSADMFDPLTGLPRPAGTVSRSKPLPMGKRVRVAV